MLGNLLLITVSQFFIKCARNSSERRRDREEEKASKRTGENKLEVFEKQEVCECLQFTTLTSRVCPSRIRIKRMTDVSKFISLIVRRLV